ncbi:hypothetical protein H2201_001475 [Coniosporium apollinis]|uniref:Uncharacterized protein n=1 Tax=Coniosporium apollinis TaxID=61459 RepID=A0ABQ9P242_9PEZI|nr:hypothetical protein H2201_001475 [Coniosporium apollinis]
MSVLHQQYPTAVPSGYNAHTRDPYTLPHGAHAAARAAGAASTHGKLHKRANSASSIHSPASPQSDAFSFKRSDTPRVTYEESVDEYNLTNTMSSIAKPAATKIKPYLRKLSLKDANTLDLSRPAAENESLAGLGIHDYGTGSRSVSDVSFAHATSRTRHNRSMSATSQFSTASGGLRQPTAAYVHPMRQTPRPYTPPISKSYSASNLVGEDVDEAEDIVAGQDMMYRSRTFDVNRRSRSPSAPPPNTLPPLPPLQIPSIPSSASMTRLGSHSQTSLHSSTPTGRPRKSTVASIETCTSTSSRPSVDKAFSFIRGRDAPVDPESRAASIRAARIAYKEKEEAKDRKAEKEALKKQDKDSRKLAKREYRQRSKSTVDERRTRTRTLSGSETVGSAPVGGRKYSDYTPAHTLSLPAYVPTGAPPRGPRAQPERSSRKKASSGWLSFITWLRTRLLKLGRKLHLAS